MAYFNAVAEVAEAETHHPDLHLTSYRDVRLELSTHAVGGCAPRVTHQQRRCESLARLLACASMR